MLFPLLLYHVSVYRSFIHSFIHIAVFKRFLESYQMPDTILDADNKTVQNVLALYSVRLHYSKDENLKLLRSLHYTMTLFLSSFFSWSFIIPLNILKMCQTYYLNMSEFGHFYLAEILILYYRLSLPGNTMLIFSPYHYPHILMLLALLFYHTGVSYKWRDIYQHLGTLWRKSFFIHCLASLRVYLRTQQSLNSSLQWTQGELFGS
jgi:hypothetical protein